MLNNFKQQRESRQKKRGGFLLVDCLIALLVVGVALSGILMLYSQGMLAADVGTETETATNIAVEQLELARAQYAQNQTLPAVPASVMRNNKEYTLVRTETAALDPTGANSSKFGRNLLKRITITVSWAGTQNTGANSLEMSNYLREE